MRVRVAGEERLIAAEDAGRYRDALGAMPPSGLPDAFLERTEEPLRSLLARYAARPRPVRPVRRAIGSASTSSAPRPSWSCWSARTGWSAASSGRGGTEREWCDPDVLRRIRRASLAALRKEVEPVEQVAFARFVPAGTESTGASLREALVPLQGLALPVALWESEVLPRRVPNYAPAQLDQLCATGEPVWVEASDRVAVLLRRGRAGQPEGTERPEGEVHDRIREGLAKAPSSGSTCSTRPARRGGGRPRSGSSSGPARSRTTRGRRSAPAAATACRSRSAGRATLLPPRDRDHGHPGTVVADRPTVRGRAGPAGAGRACWSARESSPATASALRNSGGYSAVYGELKALEETLGLCRRGYFVEGLGGAQFALGGAVERIRELRPREEEPAVDVSVLAAADPAQPYGAALAWPKRAARERLGSPARTSS